MLVHDLASDGKPGKRHKPLDLRKPAKAILPLGLTPVNEPLLVVGAGEDLVSFDTSEIDEPDHKATIEAHWHDVSALRLWVKRANTSSGFEPIVVSASLDGTVRKWTLKGTSLHHLSFIRGY